MKLEYGKMNFIGRYLAKDTDFCDLLIKHFDESNLIARGTILNKEGVTLVDSSVKDTMALTVDFNDNKDEVVGYYNRILKACIEAYKNEYGYCDGYSAWGLVEPGVIQLYNPFSTGFIYHTERFSAKSPASNRHLVFMTYLNDVNQGGETEFFYQKLLVKPQKGLTLIWPADWTHTHRGNPLGEQKKYIITGWLSYI